MSGNTQKKALILGGNRFFGKVLAQQILADGYQLTLLNRGNCADEMGSLVERIVCDRTDKNALNRAVDGRQWDFVFDQICYEYKTATEAADIFKGKVGKYIFTSSKSVYDAGANLKESDFAVESYAFEKIHTKQSDYAEAKRQAERGFFEKADFPIVLARLCIVLGPDDPTRRLKFHVDRASNSQPICFPNLQARLSMIHSEDAARALKTLAESELTGPVNVSCESPILIQDFVTMLESVVGTSPVLCDKSRPENHSPYGISQDWYLNTSRLKQVLVVPSIETWLPSLMQTLL